jgi:hypothetical protein
MKHYSPTGKRNHGRPLKRDRNRSTSGPTPWQIYDDNDDDDDDDEYSKLCICVKNYEIKTSDQLSAYNELMCSEEFAVRLDSLKMVSVDIETRRSGNWYVI